MRELFVPQSLIFYQVTNNQLYSKVGEEAVLLDLDSGNYYGLNETGNRVWQWLQQPKSVVEILDNFLEEYEVTQEQAYEDLQALLKSLLDAGLIEVVNQKTT
ncbi:MAG TPA: PqqD family protein [Xenococcaceae cyanobacterium]